MNAQARQDRVILVVVCFLGTIALVLSGGALWMFREMLHASEGKDSIDPAVVGIFGTVCTLAGGAVGGLAGMLASTRTAGGQAEPPPPAPPPPG